MKRTLLLYLTDIPYLCCFIKIFVSAFFYVAKLLFALVRQFVILLWIIPQILSVMLFARSIGCILVISLFSRRKKTRKILGNQGSHFVGPVSHAGSLPKEKFWGSMCGIGVCVLVPCRGPILAEEHVVDGISVALRRGGRRGVRREIYRVCGCWRGGFIQWAKIGVRKSHLINLHLMIVMVVKFFVLSIWGLMSNRRGWWGLRKLGEDMRPNHCRQNSREEVNAGGCIPRDRVFAES